MMKRKKLLLFLVIICFTVSMGCKDTPVAEQKTINDLEETAPYYQGEPLKVAVIGLVHTHVHWILGREKWGDIEIVGIVEPNRELALAYSKQHGYSMDIVHDTMDELYAATKPEAVTAFNTIYDHLKVVEFFAPKGVHIMVEKPLAVSWQHAQKMAEIAKANKVYLLTNYETSWYGSNYDAHARINQKNEIGAIQRMVFHHGHPGPIEIGCNTEFLEWLTDPVLNGGGALTDFGCYGANLATWFLKGEKPVSVAAISRNYKPEKYPNVDDDATIILNYKESQVIVQASWNWSHNRKDMEIYGASGYVICKNGEDMEILLNEEDGPLVSKAAALEMGVHDPFAYLNNVVKNEVVIADFSVSSLENNLIVMQILEIAKEAATTGKTIAWDTFFAEPQR
ncbi:Gfo/Idh/MocA family oxidoreductase [uncultured Croceitalea sp.]|uniref:Gfo/Idh/MocA family protein n=1 Tax=uncultured Croceitalea sp. TaxID=1798908 RepID=UPI0033059986